MVHANAAGLLALLLACPSLLGSQTHSSLITAASHGSVGEGTHAHHHHHMKARHAREAAKRHAHRRADRRGSGDYDRQRSVQPPPQSLVRRGPLYSGSGPGTLYYDINGGGTCGPINGWYSYAETGGYAMCEPWTNAKTLGQRGSNRVVAIPSNMLDGNQAKYCGKEISVTWNGKTVNNLIVWDGCASCNNNDGLDFSSTVFGEIFGANNCGAGRMTGMTWQILDTQVWSYPSGDPVSGGSDDAPSSSKSPVASLSEKLRTPSSTSKQPETTTSEKPKPPPSSTTSSSHSVILTTGKLSDIRDGKGLGHVSTVSETRPVNVVQQTTTSSVASPTSSPSAPGETDSATSADHSNDGQPASSFGTISESTPAASTPSSSDHVPPADPSTGRCPRPLSSQGSTSTTSKPSSQLPKPERKPLAPIASPTGGAGTGNPGDACDATPGLWQCNGNTLQQCVQVPSGWQWLKRVECAVSPINCDSPNGNPVCPQPVKRSRIF